MHSDGKKRRVALLFVAGDLQRSGGFQSLAGALMPRSLVTAVWLFVTLACQPEGGADADFALLDGLEVVEVGAAGDAPILPWRLSETPSVRVGGDGRGEHHQYVEISAATILRDGRVMVSDGRTGLVRLYGPDGDFRGQLGSRGEGPGEFQAPSSLLLVRGDSIWIWDHTLWRTSVFSPQGVFVRSERYDPTAAGLYPVQGMWPAVVRLSGEGSLLIHLSSKRKAKVPGGDDVDRVGLAVHRYGAAKLDLIGLLPREEQAEVEAPWGATTLTPPLAAGPRITLSREDDWACVGHQSVPELLCVSAAGHRVGLRWSSQPRSVWPGDPAIARWRDETGGCIRARCLTGRCGQWSPRSRLLGSILPSATSCSTPWATFGSVSARPLKGRPRAST
jgi:hypothetical protein